jgi:hypothetical protein
VTTVARTPPIVEVVHTLPRRVHLRARCLRHQRAACQRIADQLATYQDYDHVGIRPVTGSVVIQRESGGLDATKEAEKLESLLAHEVDDAGRPIARLVVAKEVFVTTRLAEAVVHAMREINSDFRAALQGEADLGTLGPLALVVVGVAHVSWSGRLPAPPWSSLAWYALRTFVSFNYEAMHEGDAKAGSSGGGEPSPDDLINRQNLHEGPSP